jgi:SAM-dependent methyltransferase
MQATGPNAEQIAFWNETAGPKWVALQDVLDQQIRPLGQAVMDRTGIASGERVLDVGCGTGDSTVELARRVGPTGSVTGVDLSAPMLARARQRASAAGLHNVTFEAADAQTTRLERARFDVCFSRFGVMFFIDPAAAFTNLHAALRPGGRLGFVCWQALADNPWMRVPLGAAARHITLPPPPEPGAPGPFSFADPARVRVILEGAGFGDVTLVDHRSMLTIGGGKGLDEVTDILLTGVGPTSAAMRQADPAARAAVAAAVREALAPYHTSAGVRMEGAAWLVTARA